MQLVRVLCDNLNGITKSECDETFGTIECQPIMF